MSYDRKPNTVFSGWRDAVMSVSADWTRPEKQDAGDGPDASSACADDRTKSKKQLLQELVGLRQRVCALETARQAAAEIERTGTSLGLRELLAASPAIIYTTQASGDYRCTFVSENLRAIMGYSPEEMTTDPKTWADHLHPEDAPRVLKEMGPLIERGGGTVEYRFRHRDGHYIWIQDTFRVITDQTGHASELVGAWADITERKAIETELIETRQRLQYLFSASPAIIYTTKASGDYACTFVSDNLRHIMGYSSVEMTTDPKCWPDHLHPDDAPRVLKEVGPLIERGGGTVEYRFRHRDGHYIWIQDTFRVITDQTGHAFELVGAWADITERKAIETELIETRQRLQYLLSVSPAIIYTTKASGDYGCTFVSENLRDIMGYSPIEMTTDPKCWPDHLHPDDTARVMDEVSPLIEKGGGTLNYRFRHRDGHYIWIQDTFKVVNDENGHPVELVGAWADSTQSKSAEQRALTANAELQ